MQINNCRSTILHLIPTENLPEPILLGMYSSCTGNNEKTDPQNKTSANRVHKCKKSKKQKEDTFLHSKYLSLVVVEQNSAF